MKKINIVLNLKSSTSFKYLRFNSNSSNGGIFDWEFNFVHLLATFERIKSRQRQQMQIYTLNLFVESREKKNWRFLQMCFSCKSKIILQPWERGKKGKRLKNPIANNLFEAQQQQQQ